MGWLKKIGRAIFGGAISTVGNALTGIGAGFGGAVVPVSGPDYGAFEREQREFNYRSGQQYSVMRQDFDNYQVAQRELNESACRKLNSLSEQQYALERAQGDHMAITRNNENKLREVDRLMGTFHTEQRQINDAVANRCTELAEQQNSIQRVQSAQLEINRHNEHRFAQIDRCISNFQADQRQFNQNIVQSIGGLAEQQNTLQRAQAVQMEVNRSNADKFRSVDQCMHKMQQMQMETAREVHQLGAQQNLLALKQTEQKEVNQRNKTKIKGLKENLGNFEMKQTQLNQSTSQDVLYLQKKLRYVKQKFNTQEQIVMFMAFVMTVLITIVLMKW